MKSLTTLFHTNPFRNSEEEDPAGSRSSYLSETKKDDGVIVETTVDSASESKDSDNLEAKEEELLVYTDYRMNESKYRWFWRMSYFIDKFGEIRGVERTPPQKRVRTTFSYLLRLTGIWCGAALSIPSMTGFFLGSTAYGLSFRASLSSGILGMALGSVVGAYGATIAPRAGMRGMMQPRFFFGWWFAKFISILNCLTIIGWLMINGNFGGQFISAMTNGKVSIQIGILIIFLVTLALGTIGLKLIMLFDTFFILPFFVAFLLCYICTGKTFDVTSHSKVSGLALRAAWVTNFGATIGITSTYAPGASDTMLDMAENMGYGKNKLVLYFLALAWILIPTTFTGILGVGIGSAALYNDDLMNVYNNLGGGGLIVHAMRRWHGFGIFLCAVMYISLITNSAAGVYSFGLSIQSFAKPFSRCPRYILALAGAIIWYVLCAVGTTGWAEVVGNFMPMIGYWSMIYIVVVIIELEWFRRHRRDEPVWKEYLNYNYFPVLWSPLIAFGFGVAGVVLGMYQYYYTGRIARLINGGCELGTLLAIGFTGIAYIPLRYIEIRQRLKKDGGVMRP